MIDCCFILVGAMAKGASRRPERGGDALFAVISPPEGRSDSRFRLTPCLGAFFKHANLRIPDPIGAFWRSGAKIRLCFTTGGPNVLYRGM